MRASVVKPSLSIVFAVTFILLGCGESGAVEASENNLATESLGAAPAGTAGGSTKSYDEDVRLRACEAMPLDLVERLFDVPAGELEAGGGKGSCRYRYETDDHTFYAELDSIKVFDDLEKTKLWFGNMTRNATQEDVDAQKAELDREVEKREDLGDQEKKTAGTITSLMAALTPEGGVRHESVAGLGDEAKIDNESATLRVRSGNMIFAVRAYNGPRQPNPGTTNMDEIMAAQRAWNAEILPDRVRDVITLAQEVVPRMERFAD